MQLNNSESVYKRLDQEPMPSGYKTLEEYEKALQKYNKAFEEYAVKVRRDFPELMADFDKEH